MNDKPTERNGLPKVSRSARQMTVQSHLARTVPKAAITGRELKRMAVRAWLDCGIVLLRPEDLPSPFDRQAAQNIAEKLYGKRP